MMKPVSFFWYVYGTIALALVLTMMALFFTLNYVERQNAWQDFAHDIEQTLLIAQLECHTQALNHPCVEELFHDNAFDIQPNFYPHDAEFIGESQAFNKVGKNTAKNTLSIYSFQAGFQTQIDNQPEFWMRDSPEHIEEAEDNNDPIDMLITAAMTTLALLLGIAAFLYWPIKRLIQWLQQLERASDALAQEDYSVTLPTLNVSPFYQLSQRFNRMTGLIRNNLEEKRLLANAMAHEMRTPLSRARLALGLLQRKPDDAMQTGLVADLDRYLDDLEKVTDNSLQLVKLQNSEATLAELALDVWLNEKIRRVQGRASDIEWHSDLTPCRITTDERFLTLIVDNLFSNAERYAEQNVSVNLKKNRHQILLTIQDDGPGIPAELREKALQPFSRLDDSRDRRSGGIGLGLALVSTACQRLNIQLAFQDTERGLSITLTIPPHHS